MEKMSLVWEVREPFFHSGGGDGEDVYGSDLSDTWLSRQLLLFLWMKSSLSSSLMKEIF